TVAMLLYPLLGHWFGVTDRAVGILLGGTIHDVAQGVGAGYSISDEAGNAAVIVKLFRVFLLLPVVLAVGLYFSKAGMGSETGKVPVPMFAFAF
ncbi:putative sulfate exporter family transporter, partial [Methylobacterium nigriterrae]|uniref:putative sulfate exporter family transporter n=1 Tax=Methylobacterium nigriterrae TaxID=3127512 RepID=UPI003013EBEF